MGTAATLGSVVPARNGTLSVWEFTWCGGRARELAIAESQEAARGIIDAVLNPIPADLQDDVEVRRLPPTEWLAIGWSPDLDPEWDESGIVVWPRDEYDLTLRNQTAQEWVEELGMGMFGLEGPDGDGLQRFCWQATRRDHPIIEALIRHRRTTGKMSGDPP